jgi:hypothetical protein
MLDKEQDLCTNITRLVTIMSPEVQIALNNFLLIVLGAAGIAVTGIGLFLKSSFERRVKKMAEDAELQRKEREQKLEEDRKDREQKRNLEMEQMRQATAKAQADAEEAKAVGENLINLNATMIKLIENQSATAHAHQTEMSNQAQSIGDMAEGVDRMATVIDQNTVVTRATGKKADDVVATIDRLHNRLTKVFPTENPIAKLFEDFKKDVLAAIENHKLTIVPASKDEPPNDLEATA